MLRTVYVVLMLFWLFFGCWIGYDVARPYVVGTTIIPWCCMAVVGWIMFGGASKDT